MEAELVALERQGFAWPMPIVEAALRVAHLVHRCGWEAAVELSDDTFEGWEVDLLASALTVEADAERSADRRWLAKVLGVLKE